MDFKDNNKVPFCFKSIWGLMNHKEPEIDSVIRSRLSFCEADLPHVLSLNEQPDLQCLWMVITPSENCIR